MLTAMQDRNNCSQGISVQLWFKRPWSTRLSCTQHAFFAYINWFDHCLSQESIRKARHFECLGFLLLTDHRYIFCSTWNWGMSKKSHKEICIVSQIVGAWHWKSTILSTAPESANMKTFDQSEHYSRIWYHGMVASKHVSRLRRPFPIPSPPLGLLNSLANFFPFDPFFCFFPPLWSLIPGYQAQNWKIVFHGIWNARACKNEVSVLRGCL